ncbi:Phenylalanyl-tRNA synthetase alpha chain [Chelonia mydas]|uniref:phenylalanine--tRNA ligase n=1 Tax=Chelonia mydas TaxID=8469 RepID=M7BJ75_CHEMY|nr:Phenylalanyl-tRNA synthetase alpha chain [Chelonia mydas]
MMESQNRKRAPAWTKREVIEAEQRSSKRWELTPEGKEIIQEGSHEARVFDSIPAEGLPQIELMNLPSGKVGFSKAMSNKWVRLDKNADGGPRIFRAVESVQDSVREKLQLVQQGEAESLEEKDRNELKKRKLLMEVVIKTYWIRKGSAFSTTVTKQETDLTPEMIASGSWRDLKFKAYNFEALGIMPESGHLHPLLKVRTQFRQIFLEMGFTEMPTNNFIESSFWNFDALFQPQQHPARDQHDTFFLQGQSSASPCCPQAYLLLWGAQQGVGLSPLGGAACAPGLAQGAGMASVRACKVSTSPYLARPFSIPGSLVGQGESLQPPLHPLDSPRSCRSHGFPHGLSEESEEDPLARRLRFPGEKFTPAKYFSIDRVFRNETLDATHLAEFHQIEGVVADYGLTLGDLMGTLREFFTKLGISQLRFKPAYNPYTEPSMEVFSYHQGLQKWVEVGNSGIFRPEMLLPMGLPEGVSVIAWGLSLERPTMIKYGINNIRELVGHKVNLQMVYDGPLCRLDE